MILIDWLLGQIDHADLPSMRAEAAELAKKKRIAAQQYHDDLIKTQSTNAYNSRLGHSKVYPIDSYPVADYPKPDYGYDYGQSLKAPKRLGENYYSGNDRTPRYLSPEEKEKIVHNGKSWRQKNLQILEEERVEPLEEFSTYYVSLVAVDGDDLLVPRKEWRVKSVRTAPVQLTFNIPANTAIVGLLVSDGGGKILKSKKFVIPAYRTESIFNLNCKIEG